MAETTIINPENDVNETTPEKPNDIEKLRASRGRYDSATDVTDEHNRISKSEVKEPSKKTQKDDPRPDDETKPADKGADEDDPKDDGKTHEEEEPTGDSRDKQIRDKDRYIQETRTELNRLKQNQERLQGLLKPYEQFLKRDENGNPIDWDFSSLEGSQDDPEPKLDVEEPDWDELDLLPAKERFQKERAYQKAIDKHEREHAEWEKRQQDRKARKSENQQTKPAEAETTEAQKLFMDSWNNSLEVAGKEFPGADQEGSELNTKAAEVLKEYGLGANPNGPYLAVKIAASELGVKPGEGGKPSKPSSEKPKPKPKDKTYITSIGSEGKTSSAEATGNEAVNVLREKRKRFQVED
jgi:hypothetical protein